MKALAITAAIAGTIAATACTPEQIEVYRSLAPHEQAAVQQHWHEQHRPRPSLHPFLTCVRHHESDRGPYPHANGYGAQNPRSSASGAYQFLDSTWRNVSARAGHAGYSRAKHAPMQVQDAVALWTLHNIGRSPWAGTGC